MKTSERLATWLEGVNPLRNFRRWAAAQVIVWAVVAVAVLHPHVALILAPILAP